MKYSVILFDLDGTLTDSALGVTECVKYALTELGFEIPNDDILKGFIGPPLEYSFKNFCGFDDVLTQKAISLYRARYADTGLFEASVYNGIKECLEGLKAEGMMLCIASSKPTVFVRKILEEFGLEDFFYITVGTPLEDTSMTKTEVISLAVNLAGDSNAVMVGDRCFDALGAKDNGIDFIGVTYGYGGYEELCDYPYTALIDSPEELLEYLSD